MLQKNVIILIEAMAEKTGRTPGTIGFYAAGSGDFYSRLVAGHDLTTRRAERVVTWLSHNWPAHLVWPADIPRPAPAPKDDAA